MEIKDNLEEKIILEKTAEWMLSDDYKIRFKAEYYQLKIRIFRLKRMLNTWVNGTLETKPKCSYELMISQLNCMKNYLGFLDSRARIEEINLNI